MNKSPKNETLILYNSVEFFMDEIKKRGYPISKLYQPESFRLRSLRKISEKLSTQKSFLYGKWKKDIQRKKTLILFAPFEEEAIRFIRSKNPEIKIIYWYWNPAYRIGRPNDFLRTETELWTFDFDDAERYQMRYNNTFYFNNLNLNDQKETYDILFVGRNKHRKEKLLELKTGFETKDYKTYFYIVPNNNEKNPEKIKELSYSEYLNLLGQTKAILDIMPPSQVGLTLRPMESVFLGKKLITDNPHVDREPFYNPNNIFILGVDDETQLREFLDSPYEPVSNEILNQYDFDTWMQRILNGFEFNYD